MSRAGALVAAGVLAAACTADVPAPPSPPHAPSPADPGAAKGQELYRKLREAPVVEIVVDHGEPVPHPRRRVKSPSGWAEAYLADWGDGRTQVMVELEGGACASGATDFRAHAEDLRLRWSAPDVLEVEYPRGSRFERSANGEVFRCRARSVREVLKAR